MFQAGWGVNRRRGKISTLLIQRDEMELREAMMIVLHYAEQHESIKFTGSWNAILVANNLSEAFRVMSAHIEHRILEDTGWNSATDDPPAHQNRVLTKLNGRISILIRLPQSYWPIPERETTFPNVGKMTEPFWVNDAGEILPTPEEWREIPE